MKGAFVPQSKPVPFKASIRDTMMDNSRQALPEKDRKVRTRTSAATLGLAIAMGTSSFIVLRQGDSVMAAEPVADTALGDASLTDERRNLEEATEKTTTNISEETPQFVTHVVQEDENLWTLARMYQTPVRAIADANDLQLTVLLHVGQELKIPHPQNPHPEKNQQTVTSQKHNKQQLSEEDPSQTHGQAATAPATPQLERQEGTQRSSSDVAGNLPSERSEAGKNGSSKAATASQSSASLPNREPTGSDRASAIANSPSTPASTPSTNKAQTENGLPRSKVASASNNQVETPSATTSKKTNEMAATQQPEVPPLSSSIDVPPLSFSALAPEVGSDRTNEVPQLPQIASQTFSQPTWANQTAKHKVRPGETIYSLARQYNVSPGEIIKANGINNPNLIEVGQTLLIPRPVQPAAENQPTIALNTDMRGNTMVPSLGQSGVTDASSAILPNIQLSDSLTDTDPLVGAEGTTTVGVDEQTGSLQIPDRQMVEDMKTTGSVAYQFSQDRSPTNDDSKYQPYVEGLRSEISRLRDRSHRETRPLPAPSVAGEQANTNGERLPSILSNNGQENGSTVSERVNPDFAARNRNSEEPLVPSQNNRNTSVPTNANSPQEGDSENVAVAPLGAENYAPILPPRMVSPELPPLPEPNRMIPEGESSFNGYIWPAKGVLTSGYGWRWGRMHRGIDIAGPIGTPIVASASGVVTEAGWNSGGYGNLVEIQHSDGSLTLYAHNSRILVGKGQRVEQGQQVAEMGNTGYSTGPHLHFEVHPPGKGAVDPLAYLPPKRNR